jgi:hypothetical protein
MWRVFRYDIITNMVAASSVPSSVTNVFVTQLVYLVSHHSQRSIRPMGVLVLTDQIYIHGSHFNINIRPTGRVDCVQATGTFQD